MDSRRLRALIIVAAAVLLHLSAHFAPWSAASTRGPLPEDGPAFVLNHALDRGDGAAAAAGRAVTDPGASWDGAADCVGRSRWRPVATLLLVVEKFAPWASSDDGAVRGAALVSLLLHVFVALGAARLAADVSRDGRAALAAGLLAAASPVALSAAAWPARQAVVLATALALGGTLVALRGGRGRVIGGGSLVALAGLSHEAAFGWALTFRFLRRAPAGDAGAARDARLFALIPAAAFVGRCAVLGGLGADLGEGRFSGLLDGAAGIVASFVQFALPARLHFADGPFSFGIAGRAAGLVALVLGCAWLYRRAARPASATALAAVVALAPLVFVGFAGGAPLQDSYVYVALPLLAATAGVAFAAAAAGARPMRTAAVAAAAMLLGATVAATSTSASSFRTKSGLVELAKRETPDSLVVRTWDFASRASGPANSVTAEMRRFTAEIEAAAPTLKRDAVAAATVSKFLIDYANRLAASSVPLTDTAYDAADAAAVVACYLRPRSATIRIALAALRLKTGALGAARDASNEALVLAPDDVQVLTTVSEVALAIGSPRFAADTMEHAREIVRPDPKSPDRDFTVLYARAIAADGTTRVLPWSENELGMRYGYDVAAEELEKVLAADPKDVEVRKLLYDVYLRYGDLLASLDRTAMAVVTYDRAVDLTLGNEKSDAWEHRLWLTDRLAKEQEAASDRILQAQKTPGQPDVANALVALYVAFCRANNTVLADDLYAKLAHDLGPSAMPKLRYFRAVHRLAARELPEDQDRAEQELRLVIRDEPGLAKAHFELAHVLEWEGTEKRLSEARDEYRMAASLEFERPAEGGMAAPWSLDALERADAITEYLKAEKR